ncbi:MAG: TOBE domain-containing protein, partial [Acetobacteraceae bacterium]|nr:TOBE domain-containing protein [Acetobacteraceae bacterium]
QCRLGADACDGVVNRLTARVERSVFRGSFVEHLVSFGGGHLVLQRMDGAVLPGGTAVVFQIPPERVRVFPAATD